MEDKDFLTDIEIAVHAIQPPGTPQLFVNEESVPIDHETSSLLLALRCIKDTINSDSRVQRPHIAWQLIHRLSEALATEYPTIVHFSIAREALIDENITVDRTTKEYKDIVIQVASSLSEHCRRLKVCLSAPVSLKKTFDSINNAVNEKMGGPPALSIVDWSTVISDIDSYFEEKNLFWVDRKFLGYLKKIGPNGKDIANGLKDEFLKSFTAYKNTDKYPLSFWFNPDPTPERPVFFSYAWMFLAKVIWHDEVSRRANLITKGVPAIIENDQRHLIDMVSHDKKITETETQIQVFRNGQLLGEIPLPLISEGTIDSIRNGVNKMNLIEGHRVLRYVPRTAFNQAINGDTDYRIIKRESFRDIAAELDLKGERSITDMKEVFQAMAFLDFKRQNFSGNLIALKRFKSTRTHRLDGVEITVGTALLPYRACEDFKSGESNLMIPILSDPLVVGSNIYHAGQYLFQMLIMGEFVRQSVDFAKHDCIKITQEMWKQMAKECNILPILNQILDRWTQDGNDGPRFLQVIDKDFYTLGSSYQKETDFLTRQGNLRIKQSNRGRVAAYKRIESKK
jgi:hypothetical protein